MGRLRPPAWLRAFARLREIVTVLFANGFGWFVRAMRLDACVSLRCRTVCAVTQLQCRHHLEVGDSAPERVGAMLEHLGPTFVKLGQLASLRPDFVPIAFAEPLRRLQDRAEPMSAAVVERVVVAETGSAPGQAFASFDPRPVASASISQVHRAVLADGTEVAVKVQRPEVARLVARDLELIELMAARLERYSPRARRFRPRRAAAEFASYTRRELDFVREARTMEQVRLNMRPESAVVIPRVHWPLTTSRLLVMDFVDGVRVDDRAGIESLGIDTRRAAEHAAAAMFRQIFLDGLFHADPHPGNVLLLAGDRVAFLDFGMFGRIDPWLRHRIARAFGALAGGDPERAADQLIRSATLAPDAEIEDYRFALGSLVAEWRSAGSRTSMAQLMLRELGLGVEFGAAFPRELMLVARALVTAEGSVHAADPSIEFAELAEGALGGISGQLARSASSVAGGLVGSGGDALELVGELPVLVPRLVDLLERRDLPGGAGDGENGGRPPLAAALVLAAAGLLAGWTLGSRSSRHRP